MAAPEAQPRVEAPEVAQQLEEQAAQELPAPESLPVESCEVWQLQLVEAAPAAPELDELPQVDLGLDRAWVGRSYSSHQHGVAGG